MGNKSGFLAGLEKYLFARIKTSPIPWSCVGIAILLPMIVLSICYHSESSSAARNKHELVKLAASEGDYNTARKYYSDDMGELRDLVYPALKIEERILVLKDKLKEYPESVELYLAIANLYTQTGETSLADEYREKARILNPIDLTP